MGRVVVAQSSLPLAVHGVAVAAWSIPLIACIVLAGPTSIARAQPATCARSTAWQEFVRCQYKRRAELVRDVPSGKLVSLVEGAGARRRLVLIVRRQGLWSEIPLYAELGPTMELLDAQQLAPDTYRIDLGFASTTSVTIDQVSTRPALLRRRFTYVCPPKLRCQTVITRCELFVHGKAIGGFRGDVVWNGSALSLRADVRAQNRYCMPPQNLAIEEPDA